MSEEEKQKEINTTKKVKLAKDDKRILLPVDINLANLCAMSVEVFETPFEKGYLSKYLSGDNKNVHIANVFKLCVLLGCTPNKLYDYENWEYKASQIIMAGRKITNEEIKELL